MKFILRVAARSEFFTTLRTCLSAGAIIEEGGLWVYKYSLLATHMDAYSGVSCWQLAVIALVALPNSCFLCL